MSQDIPKAPMTKIGLKTTYLNFHFILPGANELKNVIVIYDNSYLYQHKQLVSAAVKSPCQTEVTISNVDKVHCEVCLPMTFVL